MKRLLTILLVICSVSVFGQKRPAPTPAPTSLTTFTFSVNADSSLNAYSGSTWLWWQILSKYQADKLYQPLGSPVATPFSLSAGYGLSGSSFNGSVARTWTADTASAGGLVSKSRLATNLTGYVPKTTTLTINGSTRDLSTNRIWNVGTVLSVGATAGTGISISGSPITSSGNITVTNTLPDQTVVLNNGTGISATGTYPNFTVTNTAPDQTVVLNAGTGISTSGTYPNFTITNTSPSSGGTVTSITPAYGLTPQTAITSSGTFGIDTLVLDTVYAKIDSLGLYVKKTGDTMTGTLNGTDIVLSGDILADSVKVIGGTSTQALMADGSVYALQDSLTKKANRTFDNVASGAIANIKLANSTISGVALGSNLNALTLGYGLTGTSYNGSANVTATADTAVVQTVSNFFPKGDTRYAKIGDIPTLGTSTISLGGTANGLSYSAGNYRLHKVTATTGGVLTTGTDTIAGNKRFTGVTTFATTITSSTPAGFYTLQGSGVSTDFSAIDLRNGSGTTRFGTEGNSGNKVFTGSTNNASIFGSSTNTPIEFGLNGIIKAVISTDGTISSTPQGTLYGTASGSITSAQLATSLTDETGTGSAVFSNAPSFTSATFSGQVLGSSTGDGSSYTTAQFKAFSATNPGIGFHISGVYGASLYMGSSGILNWNGTGFSTGAITGTSATFSGVGNGVTLNASTGTINTQYKVANTSGDNYFGVAGSDGSSVFTGTTANSGYVGTNLLKSFHIATGGAVRYTIDASGQSVWNSSISSDWNSKIINSNTTNGYGLYVQGANNASTYLLGLHNGAAYKFTVAGDGALTGTSATFTGTLVQQNITDGVNLFGQNTQEGTRRANLFSTSVYTAFQTVGATTLQLGTNNITRYTIDASGNNTWTGSGTFGGTITSTVTSGDVLTAGSATTGGVIANFYSSGANFMWGINNSTGSNVITTSAYATYLFNRSNTDLVFGTNEIVRYTISAAGNNTWTGSGTFGGGLTSRSHNIYEASAARGAFAPYNLVVGGGTDYSVGIFSEGEIYMATGGSATKKFTMSTTGAATFSGNLTAANLTSGTYTPTPTNISNTASFTTYALQYLRVGNTATVSGRLTVQASSASDTEFRITLPIASNFTATTNAGGSGVFQFDGYKPVGIKADITNDQATFFYAASSTATNDLYFSFTYQIL